MGYEYKRGEVVNVYFPNDDPKSDEKLKDRPAIILRKYSATEFLFICITGTDWRNTHRGFWIERNTKDFSTMRLLKPSFINLDDVKKLPETSIRSYRGYCPKIDEIEKILGITNNV